MKQITLIAEDFEDINIPVNLSRGDEFVCLDGQYSNSTDCPINRALKRSGIAVSRVYEYYYINDYERRVYIKGYPYEVERCRLELLAGRKESYIEVL